MGKIQHCIILYCFFGEVILKTRASGFIGFPNARFQMWFQMFSRFWTPDETPALVFEIVLKTV